MTQDGDQDEAKRAARRARDKRYRGRLSRDEIVLPLAVPLPSFVDRLVDQGRLPEPLSGDMEAIKAAAERLLAGK